MTDDQDDKITSLMKTLAARADEERKYFASRDRLYEAQRILAKAVQAMRYAGLDDDEIVRVLRFVANVISKPE